MAHISLLPNGEAPWGVTDEPAMHSQIFAHGADGKLTYARPSPPRQIRTEEIPGLANEFALVFRNAKLAGFDGVEIHAANGYLLDQFMNSALNTRADSYGGRTPETRTRLVLEAVDAAIGELGAGRVGVRVSPGGTFNSMPADPLAQETLLYLCDELNRREVAYLHLVYQLMPRGNMEHSEFKETHLPHDLL
jgi:N-ethylmaleimide reductase